MLDILVGGGGYVGLSVAVSIKKAAPHLSIMVADAAPEGVWKKDARASAIAAGLAQGLALKPAIERAHAFVQEAIRTAPGFGGGHGPLNHAHSIKAE